MGEVQLLLGSFFQFRDKTLDVYAADTALDEFIKDFLDEGEVTGNGFHHARTAHFHGHYAYMAKNTYWFNCWETLSYYQEDWQNRPREIGRKIYLVPSGFEGFDIDKGAIVTTDADTFWAAPVKMSL